MTSGKISVLSPGTHYYDYKISDFLLFNFVRSKEMCYIHDQKIYYDDTLRYENNQSPSQLHKISLCYWPKKDLQFWNMPGVMQLYSEVWPKVNNNNNVTYKSAASQPR